VTSGAGGGSHACDESLGRCNEERIADINIQEHRFLHGPPSSRAALRLIDVVAEEVHKTRDAVRGIT